MVPALAVHKSHEVGTPVTTLASGKGTCWLYSLRTIDDWGARPSAE